jgi:hypothetical protein
MLHGRARGLDAGTRKQAPPSVFFFFFPKTCDCERVRGMAPAADTTGPHAGARRRDGSCCFRHVSPARCCVRARLTDAAVGAGGDRGDASCRSSALSPATDSKTTEPRSDATEHQAAAPQSRVMVRSSKARRPPLRQEQLLHPLPLLPPPHTHVFPLLQSSKPPRLAATSSSRSRSR